MGKFLDKVAVITGASGGIGASTALALAREGAKVAICGRNEDRLNHTAKACKDAGAEVLQIVSDVSKFENLEPLINQVVERFSSIDILVNSAGRGMIGPIENLPLENYEDLFETNVRAPVFLCKYALPHLKKTKGCVVNVSSCAAVSALPANVPYCMSKCALDHFSRGFAAETVQFGVKVNTINPGAVNTGFWNNLGVDEEVQKGMMGQILARQKLGLITADAVAEGIVFLCSSKHITGTSLVLDGGLLLPA